MNRPYRFKWPLLLLLTGFLLRIIAALIKIMHWFHADYLLITGTIIMAAAIVWLMTKLITAKQQP